MSLASRHICDRSRCAAGSLTGRWFVILVALLFGLLYQVSGPMLDDYWFSDGAQGLSGLGEKLDWLREIELQRRQSDVWRFANILGPVFLVLLPRMVFSVLTASVVYITLRQGTYLLRPAEGSLRVWLFVGAYVLLLPWYDGIVCVMFALNYVWASMFALLFIRLFFHGLENRETESWTMVAGSVALAFIAGWIHEGFCLPLLCGAVAMMFYLKMRGEAAGMRRVLMTLSLIGGLLMIVTSASFGARVDESAPKLAVMPLREIVVQLGPSMLIVAVYISSVIAVAIHRMRSGHGRLTEVFTPADIFFGGAVAAALFLELRYYGGARLGWSTELFALIGMLRMWGEWRFRLFAPFRLMWRVLIAAAVVANLVAAIGAQMRLTSEAQEVSTLFKASADGCVYYDVMRPRVDLSLLKTSAMQFHQRIPMKMFSRYHAPDKSLTLLPKALKGFRASDSVASRHSEGIYFYGGYIVAQADAVPDDADLITLQPKEGTPVASRYRVNGFTGADGREYLMITPHLLVMEPDTEITDAWF